MKNRLKDAINRRIEKEGSQVELALKSKIGQGAIASYLSEKRNLSNAKLQTLEKLFPEMEITFFKDERQVVNSDLSSIENKIMLKVQQLNEDAQLDLFADLAVQLDKSRAASKHPRKSVA